MTNNKILYIPILSLFVVTLLYISYVSALKATDEPVKEIEKKDDTNLQRMKVLEAGVDPDGDHGSATVAIDYSSNTLDPNNSPSVVEHENIITKDNSAIYTVSEGDSLASLSKYFGVSIESIVANNNIKDNKIKPGMVLEVPPVSGINYIVKSGDTLEKIAKKYNIESDDIALFNDVFSSDEISIGDELYLPGVIVKEEKEKTKSIPKIIVKAKQWANGDTSHLNTPESIRRYSSLPVYSGYYIFPSPGATRTQKMHGSNGVDLANQKGKSVVASAGGVVRVAKNSGYNFGYGNYIIISHPNGSETLYAHNSVVLVNPGQTVVQGQEIAKIGSTGNSTGLHVHFEIKGAYNPFAW